jgi:hypothetical protein
MPEVDGMKSRLENRPADDVGLADGAAARFISFHTHRVIFRKSLNFSELRIMDSTPVAPKPEEMSWTSILLIVGGVLLLLLILAALLLPQMCSARETARGNTCRSNMRACANALFQYANDNGKFPGYMNVLQRTNGAPYVDPETGLLTPVSWVVVILPYIDRRPTFDQWRIAPQDHEVVGSPPIERPNQRVYIDLLLCPSDPQASKTGAPISFVVNTGQPDRPAAVTAADNGGNGIPREWPGNGLFFDNYTEHQLIKTTTTNRGPMIYSTDRIPDRPELTILLTENVDAGEYVFDARTQAADNWRACEVTTGCIWRPGSIDASKKPPTMTPPVASLTINSSIGKGDGRSYDFCRPSSHHPQSVNVAYVGQNVAQLRDTVSYYVFARLMAPDDANATGVEPAFYLPDLTEADLWP